MKNKWVIAVIGIVVLLMLAIGCFAAIFIAAVGSGLGNNQIALIHLTGVIAGTGSGAGAATPETMISQLKKADDDRRVKAILLRVDSPGGTAAASQEIAMQVARVKKPVIVSIGDVGASGAYMVSAAADKIVAAPASDVGSIGVIIELPDIARLADKWGVGFTVVKEGKFKDMGNPFRKLTPAERAILQADTKVTYDQFIRQVAEGRRLPVAKVRELATGRTWVGSEAKGLGLVDEIGNLQDAIDLAARLGRIKGRPNVVEYESPSLANLLNDLLNSSSGAAAARALGLDGVRGRSPVRY